MNTSDESTVNRHLTDKHKAHMEKDEQPPTANNISLRVDPCYHNAIRTLLKKHERMSSSELGGITITENRIDLVPNAQPFKSSPYWASPKTRELEQFEVQKQLQAEVIEPTSF